VAGCTGAAGGAGLAGSVEAKTAKDASVTNKSVSTRWQPGQSGNALGRPMGSGTTAQFYDDRSTTWREHGRGAMIATAKADPGRFIQVCASLIPATITPTLPGGLDPADWRMLCGFWTP